MIKLSRGTRTHSRRVPRPQRTRSAFVVATVLASFACVSTGQAASLHSSVGTQVRSSDRVDRVGTAASGPVVDSKLETAGASTGTPRVSQSAGASPSPPGQRNSCRGRRSPDK